MKLKAVLFDLDGTLLPMDQDVFIGAYMRGLARKMESYGYAPEKLIDSIWAGTGAMIKNDGAQSNEEVFWRAFSALMGHDARKDEPVFEDFYRGEFQQVKGVCGFDERAARVVEFIKSRGLRMALATNPLFPAIATHSRVRWAGLDPEDFEIITTYENSCRSKPNPDYYRDILDKMGLSPCECLMVGNDVGEDMITQKLGMKVFLLTDCLINKKNEDISRYPQGSFDELLEIISDLLAQ